MPWEIDGIPAEHVTRETPPTLTRASEVTLPLLFQDTGRPDTQTSFTAAQQYSVQYSFSYADQETVEANRSHYLQILDYLEYEGDAVVRYGTTDRGEPWFRERLPTDAPVDSLVVPVDAPDDVQEDRSMWAIVLSGVDQSSVLSTSRRVDLTLFVLAELDEYADRAAVVDDLGDEITV
jgi:hypothetical protein